MFCTVLPVLVVFVVGHWMLLPLSACLVGKCGAPHALYATSTPGRKRVDGCTDVLNLIVLNESSITLNKQVM